MPMTRRRVKLEVLVNLDLVPGTFHTPESARETVEAILLNRIGHYEPIVFLAPEK